jgi:hypothetical protein
MEDKVISWFSAGVSSAVATKIAINNIDHVIYVHIDDQHEDTLRFIKDCEQWFQKEIEIIQSKKYKCVEDVLIKRQFVNGPDGAPCTGELKKAVRKEWECSNRWFNYFTYIWGMDSSEKDRAQRLMKDQFESKHIFPLIENNITKSQAHGILKSAGISRPKMYDLGYLNNNCIGCVKGGMAYWNKIRIDFPDVFNARARMEREIGASAIKGVFLDELDPSRGRGTPPIVEECGILCGSI